MEDNLSRQIDEIEALTSIYGKEWCVQDETRRIYCIQITPDTSHTSAVLSLNLHVTMPPEYPSTAPPIYQLNAPWLRGDDRTVLANALGDIYCENIGESVIYLWVEKIREFLVSVAERDKDSEAAPPIGEMPTLEQGECSVTSDNVDANNMVHPERESAHPKIDSRLAQEEFECPEIFHGDFLSDRKSTFQAHLAEVHHKEQIRMVMDKLCENKKIAQATHNIVACRIIVKENPQVVYQDCVDDGETHAGSRMLHLLQIVDAENVIVVVTRWYGGIHLGPDRFKHINNCTRDILDKHGYIKDKKSDKKSTKGGKKSR